MAGEAQEFYNLMKAVSKQVVNGSDLMDYFIGTVVSEEYKPLQIQVDAFSDVLEEEDLILTKAVQDHWLDIEVYWETVDDNDLSEFQGNTDANIDTHNANVDVFNSHTHTGNLGGATPNDQPNMKPQNKRHTSHLHNIQGRKRIRVYNALHKGEVVLLLRCVGGQNYIVLDRLTKHIVDGEWRTHAGAVLDNQETKSYEVSSEKVLSGWKEGVKDESKWQRFSKPSPFVSGGEPPKE